jgi:hypothetical protein
VSVSEPPPVPPDGAPTEPVTAASPRAPRIPPPPPDAPLHPPEGPYPPDPRGAWWQQEAAIIGVGLLMLVAGGLLGYVIGHSNAKTRTVPRGTAVVAAPPATTTPGSTTTLTTSTTVTTPAKGQTATTRTRTRTLAATARTVTLPAKTVTVAAPPKVIRTTTTRTITTTTTATSSSASNGVQTFTGTANETLGTIQVAGPSQLRWSCSGCASATFDITSSSSDPTPLAVHGQNAASGQVAVAAGSYSSVAVQATGSWSFTISAS